MQTHAQECIRWSKYTTCLNLKYWCSHLCLVKLKTLIWSSWLGQVTKPLLGSVATINHPKNENVQLVWVQLNCLVDMKYCLWNIIADHFYFSKRERERERERESAYFWRVKIHIPNQTKGYWLLVIINLWLLLLEAACGEKIFLEVLFSCYFLKKFEFFRCEVPKIRKSLKRLIP